MKQDDATCKTFEPEPWPLPPTLAQLVAGRELVCGLDAVELREMSKFTERPNVWGLAAHPILYPAGAWAAPEKVRLAAQHAAGRPEALAALQRLVGMFPLVQVRGLASDGRPTQIFAPQNHARLAAAFERLLRPQADALPPAEPSGEGQALPRTLVIWPEPPRDRRGRALLEPCAVTWPEEQLTILIGTDDVAAVARLAGIDPDGGRLCAAASLAKDAAGRARVLAVGTLLFGVEVTPLGKIPAFDDSSVPGEAISSTIAGWAVFGSAAAS